MGITHEGERYRPTPEYKFDALIALGENYRLGWNRARLRRDPRHLSTDSKIVATAAALYYLRGATKEVIFSTGHTSGDDIHSEAEAMRDYAIAYAARKLKKEVPKKDFKVDERSRDTSTNAEEIGRIVNPNPYYDRVVLLAPSYHRRRAMGLFGAWGVHIVKFLPAEEMVSRITNRLGTTHHREYVRRLRRSPRWIAENIKEFLLNAERYLLFDPRGIILRKITQRTRK